MLNPTTMLPDTATGPELAGALMDALAIVAEVARVLRMQDGTRAPFLAQSLAVAYQSVERVASQVGEGHVA